MPRRRDHRRQRGGERLEIELSAGRGEPVCTKANGANEETVPGPEQDLKTAVDPGALSDMRGGEAQLVDNDILVNGRVEDAIADDVLTGSNSVTSGSFANASGISTVIQNTGANVLIQNAMIVTVEWIQERLPPFLRDPDIKIRADGSSGPVMRGIARMTQRWPLPFIAIPLAVTIYCATKVPSYLKDPWEYNFSKLGSKSSKQGGAGEWSNKADEVFRGKQNISGTLILADTPEQVPMLEEQILAVGAAADLKCIGADADTHADGFAREDAAQVVGAVLAEAAGGERLAGVGGEAGLVLRLGELAGADASADADAVGLELGLLQVETHAVFERDNVFRLDDAERRSPFLVTV